MGQRNLFYLNKVKSSIFWNSNWDNFYLFSKKLNENLFLLNFFIFIFSDNIFLSNYFLSKKNYYFLNKNYYFYKNIPVYFSRLWILKFQKWLLLLIFFYNTKNKKTKKYFNFFCKKFYLYTILKKKYNFLKNNKKFIF